MSNGNVTIDENTFKGMKPADRDWLVLKTVFSNTKRISILEKRKTLHTAIAGAGGIIGGFLAIFSKKIFKL